MFSLLPSEVKRDTMTDDETLADIDLGLLNIQKNLVRIVVLVSGVLALQGLTFLFLAWMAEGFFRTVVIGVIGAGVFGLGVLVWLYNFRVYGTVALTVDDAKANHPAMARTDEEDSS